MLASESLIDALNAQVGREMGASMQYICIATYFDDQALPQLAAFFYRQSEEEREHAMRFVKFLVDVGGQVRIPQIPASSSAFDSAETAVRKSLDWEEEVTRQIYELVEIAEQDKNYIAQRFLDWFVNEQLEEVSVMGDLLQVVRRAGADGLLHVEDYLARNPLVTEGEED
ncbi:MAG: ferritin [Acidobacteriota bacterium]